MRNLGCQLWFALCLCTVLGFGCSETTPAVAPGPPTAVEGTAQLQSAAQDGHGGIRVEVGDISPP